MEKPNPLPELQLPKRFEILEQRAKLAGLNPTEFVERVDEAAKRVDKLLGSINASGCGQLELFLGLSGSGKTTFVATLPKFFTALSVHIFPDSEPLGALADFVARSAAAGAKHRLILIAGRDNPKDADVETSIEAFDALRKTFREPGGNALVVWPITSDKAATALAANAWDVGRDSVVDAESRGLYRFTGLQKEKFFDVADTTSRNLTGDGLEAFGVIRDVANGFLPSVDTITEYYARLESEAAKVRGETWSILRERRSGPAN